MEVRLLNIVLRTFTLLCFLSLLFGILQLTSSHVNIMQSLHEHKYFQNINPHKEQKHTEYPIITSVPGKELENTSIAIGLAITSKGATSKFRRGFLLLISTFKDLLPSFCKTASLGHKYHFYFAYDGDDAFFMTAENRSLWNETFYNYTLAKCSHLGDIGLSLIRCNYSGRPAWSQNDAMVAAHGDGHKFLYRINDDTIMKSPDWTNSFIRALAAMQPPFIGVVGPSHTGGNKAILTYDFVYRVHVDIFGFYYPRAFPWWYADNWMSYVYGSNRTRKLPEVQLRHTMATKTRYKIKRFPQKFQTGVRQKSQIALKRFFEKYYGVHQ